MGDIFYFLVLIFSVVIHEVSHGLSAKSQGDNTAEYAGRLTLNPLRHLDPVGSVILPLMLYITKSPILFGWALPVPYNPFNLRNQRWGPALVALAGPASNISIAAVFAILFRFFSNFGFSNLLPFFAAIIYLNLVLAIFNLVPIPPLDGSKILFGFLGGAVNQETVFFFERYGFFLVILFLFFILPIIYPIFPFLLKLLAGPEALPSLFQFLDLRR
jgi:Zn-dependent protease